MAALIGTILRLMRLPVVFRVKRMDRMDTGKNTLVMKSEIINRLESRALEADDTITWLKMQIASLHSASESTELEKLQNENQKLQADVEYWKNMLVEAENKNRVKQVPLPGRSAPVQSQMAPVSAPVQSPVAPISAPVSSSSPGAKADTAANTKKKGNANKVPATKSDAKKADTGEQAEVDIGLLDMRVGRIVSAEKHPDADSLYVEQVDVGEAAPRTVVSGLVRFVSLQEMQGRMAVLLCNLKPAKMRGVTSQAMVMCASSPDKVEILDPPAGAQPGDSVTCPGFVSRCGAQLNPKKKIFEQVALDLKTDADLRATFRSVAWEVAGKGVITSKSLANVHIK